MRMLSSFLVSCIARSVDGRLVYAVDYHTGDLRIKALTFAAQGHGKVADGGAGE
jgi:hypothetical protein